MLYMKRAAGDSFFKELAALVNAIFQENLRPCEFGIGRFGGTLEVYSGRGEETKISL